VLDGDKLFPLEVLCLIRMLCWMVIYCFLGGTVFDWDVVLNGDRLFPLEVLCLIDMLCWMAIDADWQYACCTSAWYHARSTVGVHCRAA
jgi:hypothetical protein